MMWRSNFIFFLLWIDRFPSTNQGHSVDIKLLSICVCIPRLTLLFHLLLSSPATTPYYFSVSLYIWQYMFSPMFFSSSSILTMAGWLNFHAKFSISQEIKTIWYFYFKTKYLYQCIPRYPVNLLLILKII